jgi:hypothetical protein
VVDDRLQGWLTLVVDEWPSLDESGRLIFPGKSKAVPVKESDLQEAVTGSRKASGIVEAVAERGIRIGDTFLVRDLIGTEPSEWRQILDVTDEARRAAKAAFYGAVAPVMPSDDEVVEDEEDEGPPPSGPIARPVV